MRLKNSPEEELRNFGPGLFLFVCLILGAIALLNKMSLLFFRFILRTRERNGIIWNRNFCFLFRERG